MKPPQSYRTGILNRTDLWNRLESDYRTLELIDRGWFELDSDVASLLDNRTRTVNWTLWLEPGISFDSDYRTNRLIRTTGHQQLIRTTGQIV